ncbi:hypothetical protein HOT02_gp036 [Staphylococcus phage phiSA_BS2]|uniref:Uncharacterized protein n=1 Tax=Staphylococcus phage phiSA_BS2 TaxID=2126724 RepID=A0A2R3ZXJ1_9CAUD|nr:hypothetical protein HOT02_gp036 [Staphylococcus phage phiSA_BS2]AVR55481.1 hypothetical protein phiSABS2_36 [Staphylococcus phage phiSA_BS2]
MDIKVYFTLINNGDPWYPDAYEHQIMQSNNTLESFLSSYKSEYKYKIKNEQDIVKKEINGLLGFNDFEYIFKIDKRYFELQKGIVNIQRVNTDSFINTVIIDEDIKYNITMEDILKHKDESKREDYYLLKEFKKEELNVLEGVKPNITVEVNLEELLNIHRVIDKINYIRGSGGRRGNNFYVKLFMKDLIRKEGLNGY